MLKARSVRIPSALGATIAALVSPLVLPAVVHAYDGTVVVEMFAFYSISTGAFCALAIAAFALARWRAETEPARSRVAHRGLIGGVLGSPVGCVLMYFSVVVADYGTPVQNGGRFLPTAMAVAFVLQVGYVILTCRWIGRAGRGDQR